MSTERYHYEGHIEQYDIDGVRQHGGELDIVTQEIDELLYPDRPGLTNVCVSSARSSGGITVTSFVHEYLRTESDDRAWPLESVKVAVEHSLYLGRQALKQCYKIRIDNSVHHVVTEDNGTRLTLHNRVSSLFYISQLGAGNEPFEGYIVRPDIIGEQDMKDEPMTVYDCEKLYDSISELRLLAQRDAQEAQVLRYM